MPKISVSEVQNQTEDIKKFCETYIQALENVVSVTENTVNTIGIDGVAGDSIKAYFSTVYPAICRAAILYGERFSEANVQYLSTYISECGSGDLDSDVLKEQLAEIDQNIENQINFKTSVLLAKKALPDILTSNMGCQYLLMVHTINQVIDNNEAIKKKIEEKLEKFLTFCEKSSRFFNEVSEAETLFYQGLQMLGMQTDGKMSIGLWNGDGFNALPKEWISKVNGEWELSIFLKKYPALEYIKKIPEMTPLEYKETLQTLQQQEKKLIQNHWDTAAINTYFEEIAKIGATQKKYLLTKIIKKTYDKTTLVGSALYLKMYKKYDGTDREKVQLLMKQMGAEIDENNFLQLKGPLWFDPDMAPDNPFLKEFSTNVQRAYPEGMDYNKNVEKDKTITEQELQKTFQMRHYFDLQNIFYIRSHYEGKTDYDKLMNYSKEYPLISKGARLHNRKKDGKFDKQVNDKILANENRGEFIVNTKTKEFVSQWDQYKTREGKGIFIQDKEGDTIGIRLKNIETNPEYYNLSEQAGKEIADTESMNYGGKDSDLHDKYDVSHGGLSKKMTSNQKENNTLESDIRVMSKKFFKAPSKKDYKEEIETITQIQ